MSTAYASVMLVLVLLLHLTCGIWPSSFVPVLLLASPHPCLRFVPLLPILIQVVQLTVRVLKDADDFVSITRLQQQLVAPPPVRRTLTLCRPPGVTLTHSGDTASDASSDSSSGSSSSSRNSSSKTASTLRVHCYQDCLAVCLLVNELHLSLSPDTSAANPPALGAACNRLAQAIVQASSELELSKPGPGPSALAAEASRAEAWASRTLAACSDMIAAAVQVLPVVAAEVWRPALSWQRLLGRRVAGEEAGWGWGKECICWVMDTWRWM
jgi:hypothetical protein